MVLKSASLPSVCVCMCAVRYSNKKKCLHSNCLHLTPRIIPKIKENCNSKMLYSSNILISLKCHFIKANERVKMFDSNYNPRLFLRWKIAFVKICDKNKTVSCNLLTPGFKLSKNAILCEMVLNSICNQIVIDEVFFIRKSFFLFLEKCVSEISKFQNNYLPIWKYFTKVLSL